MPFREMTREQAWLLPPTLDQLVPADHPARFVAEFVDTLERDEWAELGVDLDGKAMGAPAYHPRALLSVWLYGFMTGVRSCRKLETACRDQVSYLWLTGWQQPDHNTLWRFYKEHRQAMRSLFERTVRTAVAMKLVDLTVQALDGTKVEANASPDRTHDAEQLSRIMEQVEQAISDLEAQGEGGADSSAVHLPAELADKTALRDRVRGALDELASRGRATRINLTDADAQLMKTRRGFRPAYNAQAMVSPVDPDGETTGMLVTAVDVPAESNDFRQLAPMVEQAEETTRTRAKMTLADAGYFAGSHLEACAQRGQAVAVPDPQRTMLLQQPYRKDLFSYDEGSDTYRCPQGQTLRFVRTKRKRGALVRMYRASASVCRACPAFGVCTKDGTYGRGLEVGPHDATLRRHRAWMETDEAKRAYGLRKQLVEPVFGIIKEQQRARGFLLRGLANVSAEWTMLATAFNLRTLWSLWRSQIRLAAQ